MGAGDDDFLKPDAGRNQPDRPGVWPRLLLPPRTDPCDRSVCPGQSDDDFDALLLGRDDPAG
jgi:hypothetical protein